MILYISPKDAGPEYDGQVFTCNSYSEARATMERLGVLGVVEFNITRGDVICDFCSHPETSALYQIEPGGVMEWASDDDTTHMDRDGKWAACSVCRDLISAGDWEGLAKRSYDLFSVHHPEIWALMTTRDMFVFSGAITTAHGFFKHGWDGSEPKPIVTDKDFLSEHGIEND